MLINIHAIGYWETLTETSKGSVGPPGGIDLMTHYTTSGYSTTEQCKCIKVFLINPINLFTWTLLGVTYLQRLRQTLSDILGYKNVFNYILSTFLLWLNWHLKYIMTISSVAHLGCKSHTAYTTKLQLDPVT